MIIIALQQRPVLPVLLIAGFAAVNAPAALIVLTDCILIALMPGVQPEITTPVNMVVLPMTPAELVNQLQNQSRLVRPAGFGLPAVAVKDFAPIICQRKCARKIKKN